MNAFSIKQSSSNPLQTPMDHARMSSNPLPFQYILTRSTVRLVTGKNGQEPSSVGTGFFYKVTHPITNNVKVLIITNKHVVRDADYIRFTLSSAPSLDDLEIDGQPKDRIDELVTIPAFGRVVPHPSDAIDLCAIDAADPISRLLHSGRQVRIAFADSSWLPSEEDQRLMRDVESILVVGYPTGIWDQHNNMPIARAGVTATHPLAKYQGQSDFLLDAACFQGSSGSPVFAFESPFYRTGLNEYSPGTKVRLIGVLWGVIEKDTAGRLEVQQVPAGSTIVPYIRNSLNLGVALNASAVRVFDEMYMGALGCALP